MVKFGSSFEWAFRRALFTLLLLLVYLLIGSLLLCTFVHLEQHKRVAELCKNHRETQKGRRLDFERTELLNTLWAESLSARSESDWSLVANTKLDVYERLLASANRGSGHHSLCSSPSRSLHQWDLAGTFRSALLLLTTAGGGPITEQPPEELGPATKVFVAVFALLGIPLLLTHLEHSVTALSALIEANFADSPRWGLAAVVLTGFLAAALAVDIALVEDEQDEMERSFLDELFTVFLAFFTISGAELHQLPLPLLLPLCLGLCTLAGCLLSALIGWLQRWLAPHEFAFANGFCGRIEKAVSGARLDQSRGSDPNSNSSRGVADGHHWNADELPVIRFDIGGEQQDSREPSATATLFGLGRNSIETIEEEGELNSQGEPRDE